MVAGSRLREEIAEDWPEIERKARSHHQRLLDEGRKQEAEIFWKWFSKLSDAVGK
ncbi:MAG: hypothetical protein V3T83_17230 [Acidobacteriota bacterium]